MTAPAIDVFPYVPGGSLVKVNDSQPGGRHAMIRRATEADIPVIVAMSRKFYATTNYAALTPMSDEAVENIALMLIDTGVLLVAEHDGAVVGMVGLMILPFTFNPAVTMAAEVVWWVDPAAQGAGVGSALLDAVEPAAAERGADLVQMMTLSTSPPQAVALYERAGYRHSETCFTKRID